MTLSVATEIPAHEAWLENQTAILIKAGCAVTCIWGGLRTPEQRNTRKLATEPFKVVQAYNQVSIRNALLSVHGFRVRRFKGKRMGIERFEDIEV